MSNISSIFGGDNTIFVIIILFLLFGCNGKLGCGSDLGNLFGDDCTILIVLILLFLCCCDGRGICS